MAVENIEVIKAYGVKKIVTTCPHCFNTIVVYYLTKKFYGFLCW